MHRNRGAIATWAAVAVVLVVGGACAGTVPTSNEEHTVQEFVQQAEQAKAPGFKRRLAILKGNEDRDNKYLSTALINDDDPQGECSGVFASPQVVITAAHCLCAERGLSTQEERERAAVLDNTAQGIADATSCAKSASVKLFRYVKDENGGGRWLLAGAFMGEALPHEQFKLLFDKQHNVVWYYADLAAIILRNPVDGIDYVKIPSSEITENTPVLTAGYGWNHTRGGSSGVRRFGSSTVKRVETSEAGEVMFRTEPGNGAQVFEGDSGGPCLNAQGETLVGITSSYGIRGNPASFSDADVLSIFTSAYYHRAWLDKVIKRAGELPKATR